MALKKLADNAVTQIGKTVSKPLTKSETAAIARIIEEALVKAVNQATKSCTTAAVVCVGPEADMAHKIAEEVDRAQNALIANLQSMR